MIVERQNIFKNLKTSGCLLFKLSRNIVKLLANSCLMSVTWSRVFLHLRNTNSLCLWPAYFPERRSCLFICCANCFYTSWLHLLLGTEKVVRSELKKKTASCSNSKCCRAARVNRNSKGAGQAATNWTQTHIRSFSELGK